VAVLDSEPPLRLVEGPTVNSQLEVSTQPVSPPGTPDFDSLDLNGPKAAEETNPATRLVDKAGGTWAIVTTCSIDVQQYHFNLCPSLGSGYLVKRAGVMLGVRLVYADNYNIDIWHTLDMYYALTCGLPV
jgi:hypothetical protein